MSYPVRSSIKVLLFNDNDELLLMCADDPSTTAIDGKYHGEFWFLVGGQIESQESIVETAFREIYEETGITKDNIDLGPVVWFGACDLILSGKPTHIKQSFMVAKTKQDNISLANLTPEEKIVIKKTAWFSLDKIKNSPEIIYPVVLPQYLPDIIAGEYPKEPFEIDLAKNP